ncbi:MAG: TIGR03560 family F420-dependent LLM class oxidoreductase [Chloroflexi bacterium]|nr:TIGR03560 family F420-dependent LLM class oxidoreductase [Chloroflexota bacterium]
MNTGLKRRSPRVKFGLEINEHDWSGGPEQMGRNLGQIGKRAEDAGFHSLWVWDHFIQLRRWEDPLMEGWMMLSYLAAATDRIRLGTLVTGATYRHPAILVKQASTLDVLSAGRSYFGVGAAWNEREHKAFGVRFPPIAERFELLEDLLQIAHRTWSGETGPFEGRHVQLTEQMDNPPPVQRPHPPILIGGGGERKTLRMVAQYGDATHQTTSDPETMRHKMGVLREHCERLGRNYDEIERFCGLDISSPQRKGEIAETDVLLERIGALEEAGAQGVFFVLPKLADTDSIERFAEVIDRAAARA